LKEGDVLDPFLRVVSSLLMPYASTYAYLFKIKQHEQHKEGKPKNAKDNQQPLHRHEQKPC
jgi:hypothetical protein